MSIMLIIAAALAASSAAATETPATTAAAETAIPFISRDGVIEWKADGARGLYIRGGNGRWHYARMDGICGRLRTAIVLGFETSALDQLDRHGAIRAEGARCPIASLTKSGPPPRRKRR